jgi:putative transposase
MKKSKFTEEQIAYALRQVESGTPPADVCRQLGVSEATFYIWKKKYAHLGVSELRNRKTFRQSKAQDGSAIVIGLGSQVSKSSCYLVFGAAIQPPFGSGAFSVYSF